MKLTTLKSCLFIAIFWLLTACVSASIPFQSISDAQQALSSAEKVLTISRTISPEDQKDYLLAKELLNDAERAINSQRYSKAQTLVKASQNHSQIIIKRHQQASENGINGVKFRY